MWAALQTLGAAGLFVSLLDPDLGMRAPAVVRADGFDDLVAGRRASGQECTGLSVIDAEPLTLGRRAPRAGRPGTRGLLNLALAERARHHQLADVVQEGGEMDGLAIDVGHLGTGLGTPGDRECVEVHLAAGDPSRAGHLLEKPICSGLKRETTDRVATDERHGLPRGLRRQAPRHRRRAGEPQEVCCERLIDVPRETADLAPRALDDLR